MSKFNLVQKNKKGFTLIELLIVIGVLGILAGIILVAVDPAKRLQQARDSRRFSEVNGLLNAILNYTVDNNGTLPNQGLMAVSPAASGTDLTRHQLGTASLTDSASYSCATVSCSVNGLGTDDSVFERCLDLSAHLVDEYISEIPIDPEGGDGTDVYTATHTGYYLTRSTNGRIEIGACNGEIDSNIKIKR